MTLPTLKMNVTYLGPDAQYKTEEKTVTVMTVHFKSGTMRISFHNDSGQVKTADVSNAEFFKFYKLEAV